MMCNEYVVRREIRDLIRYLLTRYLPAPAFESLTLT
jgi:hypothetical protein